jgi:hypothetical protein
VEDPLYEERYWLPDVLDVPPTGDLDEQASRGLEILQSLVDPRWLQRESVAAPIVSELTSFDPLRTLQAA